MNPISKCPSCFNQAPSTLPELKKHIIQCHFVMIRQCPLCFIEAKSSFKQLQRHIIQCAIKLSQMKKSTILQASHEAASPPPVPPSSILPQSAPPPPLPSPLSKPFPPVKKRGLTVVPSTEIPPKRHKSTEMIYKRFSGGCEPIYIRGSLTDCAACKTSLSCPPGTMIEHPTLNEPLRLGAYIVKTVQPDLKLHSLCFRCVLCSKQLIDGVYFILQSDLICPRCLPACYLCGIAAETPRNPQRFGEYLFARCESCISKLRHHAFSCCHSCERPGVFPDDSVARLCIICRKYGHLVENSQVLNSIFSKICKLLRDHLSISIPDIPIEFSEKSMPTDFDHNGFRRLGYARLALSQSLRTAKIFITPKLPTITTASVIIHEYFHCWLFFNAGSHQIRCKIMEEGVCRLAENIFLKQCQEHPEIFSLSRWQNSILYTHIKEHELIAASEEHHSADFHLGFFEVMKIYNDSPFKSNFEEFLRRESRLAIILPPTYVFPESSNFSTK